MKINKAIEIKLQRRKDNYPSPPSADERDADMISIEALKREQARREGFTSIVGTPLPGETKD